MPDIYFITPSLKQRGSTKIGYNLLSEGYCWICCAKYNDKSRYKNKKWQRMGYAIIPTKIKKGWFKT